MSKSMTRREKMLLQTLAGHFAWLKTAHPRKAAAPLAKKAQRAVMLSLRSGRSPMRKAA